MLNKIISKFKTKKIEDVNVNNEVEQENCIVDEVQKGTIEITPIPKICCIDIDENDIKILEQSGFNIAALGTLGKKVIVPNKTRNDNVQVLPNQDFPSNLHEFDVTIIDQDNAKTIEYKEDDHIRSRHTGMTEYVLLSKYPETVFDSRPFGSSKLSDALNNSGDKKQLIINFTTEEYDVQYQPIEIRDGSYYTKDAFSYNIFGFDESISFSNKKTGREVSVCVENEQLKNFLNKYLDDIIYKQTFHHPVKWDNGKNTPLDNYIPLLKNMSGDNVSMLIFDKNKTIFHFPQVGEKGKFLKEFLTVVAPSLFPEFFPFSTAFKWKENKDYWLPNHEKLLREKESLEKEYAKKLSEKSIEIDTNLNEYSFLHDMLTESGDDLVMVLIQFFKWLGFDNVVDVDDKKNEGTILEEDIQIVLDEGLLIIECKGIGGTSKDSECSQISKIKHRRCKERKSFDVYALYVVNHQRYLPPLQRKNPPFTKHQIDDAVHDERGLLTTWQLYNLYFDIEKGLISREEAKNILLHYGLIEFKPQNLIILDKPKEFFSDGKVCIVNIDDIEIKVGDTLFVEKNNKFEKVEVEDIQLDGKSVLYADKGELGLKLSKSIRKKSKLYKQIVE